MTVAIVFVLGIANFAALSAVLKSGHPLIARLAGRDRTIASRLVLLFEFGLLFAALLLARGGLGGAAIGYALYTGLNALSAWLVLTGRI